MSVSVAYAMNCTVSETLDTGVDGATSPVLRHDVLNRTATLNSGSTPPATKCFLDSGALTAGAKTIDLTSYTATGGATGTMNGLKVQVFRFRNASASNSMTIGEGASNGYELQGNTWSIVLNAGDEIMIKKNDTAPDVSATTKNIDIAGTGTDTYEITVIAG